MRGLFITGTDTGVGKTYVACEIVRELREAGHRVGVLKPACSGAIFDVNGRPRWEDLEKLRRAVGCDLPDDRICPQRFVAPLAPPVAARQEGRAVDFDQIQCSVDAWRAECDILIVEGAGGLLCPLTDQLTMADLAEQSDFPVLVVARLGLGTINHTLLTIAVAKQRRLPVAGVIFNESVPAAEDISVQTNAHEVAVRCAVPILAVRKYESDGWLSRFGQPTWIDWWALAKAL